jgi:hypothetical protein
MQPDAIKPNRNEYCVVYDWSMIARQIRARSGVMRSEIRRSSFISEADHNPEQHTAKTGRIVVLWTIVIHRVDYS